MMLLVSDGFDVISTRPLLPMIPRPVLAVKFTIAPLFAARPKLARVRSAELTPVPPGVEVIVERPWSRVTLERDSVETAWARPLKVIVPPRNVIAAESETRLALSVRLALFSIVNTP